MSGNINPFGASVALNNGRPSPVAQVISGLQQRTGTVAASILGARPPTSQPRQRAFVIETPTERVTVRTVTEQVEGGGNASRVISLAAQSLNVEEENEGQ